MPLGFWRRAGTSRIELALDIAREHLGRPYLWGGDDPMAGFDCSGFTLEVLWSVGAYLGGDTTADGLMRYGFLEVEVENVSPGCLLFWGDERATHVEMVYAVTTDGRVFTIGASGGGSRTQSTADAIAQNAYIKVRPMRSGAIAARDPFASIRGSNGEF
jgi:cell wall-associated NlpC family hydrolase